MLKVDVPVSKYTDSSAANVYTYDEVSNDNPSGNKRIVAYFKINSYLLLGGFFMIPLSGGLNPRAVAGGPSVTRFTQSN